MILLTYIIPGGLCPDPRVIENLLTISVLIYFPLKAVYSSTVGPVYLEIVSSIKIVSYAHSMGLRIYPATPQR